MINENHNFALTPDGVLKAVEYRSHVDAPFPWLAFETSDAVATHIIATDYLPDCEGELLTALQAIKDNLTATDLRNWIKTTEHPIPLNISLEQTKLQIIKHIIEK
jgi:hypothetical protein